MKVQVSWTVAAALAAALFATLPTDVSAGGLGRVGATLKTSVNGCGACHSAGGNITSVTITGPASLDPGVATAYLVTTTVLASFGGGIDIAVQDGTLAVNGGPNGSLTQFVTQFADPPGEITHTAPKFPNVSNQILHAFNYTLPASAPGSTHILYAAAAIGPNFSGSWQNATNFTVTTRPLATSTLNASNTTSATTDLVWTGGGPEYKVVYKTGALAPTTDTDGTQVTLGAVNAATISGLSASTQYTFKAFSKLSGQSIFSTTGATATITTSALVVGPRYVDAFFGSNTTNCTVLATPCKTITYAMAQATAGTPGDAINVAYGTYDTALGEIFPIQVTSGVQLKTVLGAATVIDATGANARVLTLTSTNSSTLVENFKIMGGLMFPAADGSLALGGAMLINGGSPTIRRNFFYNNEARGYTGSGSTFVGGGEAYGGAIYVSGGTPTIVNNVFRGNIARGGTGKSNPASSTPGSMGGSGQGGAIFAGAAGGAINNNTFYGNSAIGGSGGSSLGQGGQGSDGYYGAMTTSGVTVDNNIFDGNAASGGAGGSGSPSGAAGSGNYGALQYSLAPSASNNLFHANTVAGAASTNDTIGTNSVCFAPVCASVDYHSAPVFLHLRSTSPANGAGTVSGAPVDDFTGNTRRTPPSIGAYEAYAVPTTTALGSSLNPSQLSQSITFTATVTSLYGGTPTGTVTFLDAAVPICTSVALNGAAQAQCTTSSLAAGTHSITANYNGSVTYAGAVSSALSQVVNNPNPPRLGNISTRGQVQTGNDRMIAGFIIGGAVSKTVVVNVAGPSLNPFGLAGLANPTLTLVRSSDQVTLKINDDWQTQAIPADVAAIQANGFQPNNPAEPAIIATLPPGAYTAIVEGVSGGTGVGLVGVFEVDHPEVPLINISTRGQVLTGNDRMIAGFIINGTGSQKVVVNVAGPSLNPFGLAGLPNPKLTLVRSSDQSVVATNDDWQTQTNPADVAAIQATGFQPNNSAEPAIIATLPPGAYTAIVEGVGGGTGVGLVGVFATP